MKEPIIITLIIWASIEIVFYIIDKIQNILNRKKDGDEKIIDINKK